MERNVVVTKEICSSFSNELEKETCAIFFFPFCFPGKKKSPRLSIHRIHGTPSRMYLIMKGPLFFLLLLLHRYQYPIPLCYKTSVPNHHDAAESSRGGGRLVLLDDGHGVEGVLFGELGLDLGKDGAKVGGVLELTLVFTTISEKHASRLSSGKLSCGRWRGNDKVRVL